MIDNSKPPEVVEPNETEKERNPMLIHTAEKLLRRFPSLTADQAFTLEALSVRAAKYHLVLTINDPDPGDFLHQPAVDGDVDVEIYTLESGTANAIRVYHARGPIADHIEPLAEAMGEVEDHFQNFLHVKPENLKPLEVGYNLTVKHYRKFLEGLIDRLCVNGIDRDEFDSDNVVFNPDKDYSYEPLWDLESTVDELLIKHGISKLWEEGVPAEADVD